MVLAAVGDNCESAIAAAMYHARALIPFTSSTCGAPSQEPLAHRNDFTPKWMQTGTMVWVIVGTYH